MKKFLITILIIITGVLLHTTVFAYPIGDADDIFYVTAPGPNQKVSGTINISWRMWDDDQSSIQYTAKLYDSASCQNVNYGTINSNLSGISNKNQDNTLAWNTNNTQSSTNLPDGNYCLQICAAMKNGAASYSACNSRIVKIVNHNSLPVITSNPANLTIKESDSWSYQVTAYDSNNDPLTYSLAYSTNFLQINSQTGLIKTNGNSKALPNGVNQANYKIVVSVNDGISGSVTQEFTLSVIRDNPVVTPPSTTPPPSTVPPTPPSTNPDDTTNQPAKIDILYPTDNSILKGNQNEIKWNITEEDGIKSILLEYSTSNDTGWQLIKNLQTSSEIATNTFNWDVSNITDGIYFLKITVTDNENFKGNRVSDNFLIKNKDDETQSQPLIINLVPESDSEIKENIPEISAEFVPSGTSKVVTNTIKIILNDVDITNKCTVSETGFSCKIDQPLEEGKHSINVSYTDSDGKVAGLNWTFNVNTKSNDQVLSQENIVILGREIPKNSLFILLSLICVIGIILIIPWVLYRNFQKNKAAKNKFSTTGFEEYTPLNTPSSQGSFKSVNSEEYSTLTPKYDTAKPVENLKQSASQDEIEKSLNEYWIEQGKPPVNTEIPTIQPTLPAQSTPTYSAWEQQEPLEVIEPPTYAEPAKPFQEVTPTAPQSVNAPVNPPSQPQMQVPPQQTNNVSSPTQSQPNNQGQPNLPPQNSTNTPDEPDFVEPTPVDID